DRKAPIHSRYPQKLTPKRVSIVSIGLATATFPFEATQKSKPTASFFKLTTSEPESPFWAKIPPIASTIPYCFTKRALPDPYDMRKDISSKIKYACVRRLALPNFFTRILYAAPAWVPTTTRIPPPPRLLTGSLRAAFLSAYCLVF